jgi:hypothetical protein
MDPPLCGSTAMSHYECTSSAPMEPQEASPMQHEMHVLGIALSPIFIYGALWYTYCMSRRNFFSGKQLWVQ